MQIEELLHAGALDCAIVGGHLASRDLVRESWIADEVALVVPAAHRLATRGGPVTPADLAGEPLVLQERGSATRRCFETWLATQRVRPHIVMELSGADAIKNMVEAGLGVAALSRLAVERTSTLVALTASGAGMKRRLSLIHHPAKATCPLVKKFRDLARALATAPA